MLNKLSNFLQCSALTIALAFLIVPVYGHDGPGFHPMGDADGDSIKNNVDVCIESSYGTDYHEDCLTKAGLKTPKTHSIRIEQAFLGPQGARQDFIIPVIEDDTTFQDLEIKTCDDLRDFREEMRSAAGTWRSVRFWVTVLGIFGALVAAGLSAQAGGAGGVLVGGIVAIILLEINLVIDTFNGYAESASDARDVLNCGRR